MLKKKRTKKILTWKMFLTTRPRRWWEESRWHKALAILVAVVLVLIGSMYGVAEWYVHKHADEPVRLGATFVADYAQALELDPAQTLDAMIYDLGVKHIRLVSFWDKGEQTPGIYDFSFLDWQFDKAEEADVSVSLAIGLRQPRWPECHMPKWASRLPKSEWEPKLKAYITAVVQRYKGRPNLESYQLENEYFMSLFGDCPDHSRERLVSEFNLVKRLDPNHTLIVTRSDNASPTWPVGEPRADLVGISVYKRVWDEVITNRYFEYPLPPWFYGYLAGMTELTTGRNTFVHELQAEAWPPEGREIQDVSNEELAKSMDPVRLRKRFEYSIETGMKRHDLWGAEWWYYMKVKRNEPALWQVAKEQFHKYD
jgi:hypothetical protein